MGHSRITVLGNPTKGRRELAVEVVNDGGVLDLQSWAPPDAWCICFVSRRLSVEVLGPDPDGTPNGRSLWGDHHF